MVYVDSKQHQQTHSILLTVFTGSPLRLLFLGLLFLHFLLLFTLLRLHQSTAVLSPQCPIRMSQVPLRRNNIPNQRLKSLDFYKLTEHG